MFKEPSFLKKANLFQPILVVVISIIGGTPMEGANTGKIVLLVILGAAFIVWHVECQRLINRNREMKKQACTLKNRSAALYKKTYAALSGEYENFANKLNGEDRREKKADGSRATTESFNPACSCVPPSPQPWPNIKAPSSLKCFTSRRSGSRARPSCASQATRRENTITTSPLCWPSLRGP